MAFKNIHFSPTGRPIAKIAELKNGITSQTRFSEADYDAKYLISPGDLLFAWSGQPETSIDAFWWNGPEAWLNQHIFKVVPDDDLVDRVFFYELLKYLRPHFVRIARNKQTTGLGHVTKTDLERIMVQLPSPQEQVAIAEVLGGLEQKLASIRRQIQLGKSLIAAEYDAVVAPAQETEPYVNQMTVRMGAAFKGTHFSDPGTGRPLLRIRDLKTFAPQTWTTETRKDEIMIHPGDVVVGMDAEFRATLWLGPPCLLNQRVCTFRPRESVSTAFVLGALAPNLAFYERAKSGTTVIHLNKSDIDRFTVPAISPDAHSRLTERCEPVVDRIVQAAEESWTLSALRDVLAPEIFSGRVRASGGRGALKS